MGSIVLEGSPAVLYPVAVEVRTESRVEVEAWDDARRLEAWAGEGRVNLIRLAALIGFYGHHLFQVYVVKNSSAAEPSFHNPVTAAVLAWSTAVVLIHICLVRRWYPPALKHVTTAWDLALVTVIVALAKDPRSALSVLYFLVIAAAPLRLSFGLVYGAALGAMACYLLVLGHYAFVVIGYDRYYASPELRIPRTHEVLFLLGLGTAGLLAGQGVRQARRLVSSQAATPNVTEGD